MATTNKDSEPSVDNLPALAPQPSYLRDHFRFALNETKRHQKRELIAGSIMTVVVAVATGFSMTSVVAGLTSGVLTLVGVLALIFLYHFFRYPRHLYYEHANSTALLQGAAALPLPEISVKIIEAFILPEQALCILHVSLHNVSTAKCELPPAVDAYTLSIQLKDSEKIYEGHRFVTVFDRYRLSLFEDDVEFDNEGYAHEVTKQIDQELLLPAGGVLKRGEPIYPWIGFQLRGLPKWPYKDEPTGRAYEEPIFDEDGEPIRYEWVEETERVLLTDHIEIITLTVTDPFERQHSGSKSRPFHKYGRRIMKNP